MPTKPCTSPRRRARIAPPSTGWRVRAAALAAALLLAPPASRGEEAPWAAPLKVYQGLSATFGEYRPSHLHAGVDLSTGGRNGWRVYAAADGEIFRVSHTRRGYGKALYLRHRGGYISLYAHLSRFDAALGLEEMIRRREGPGRYAGSVLLDKPIPVRRGQVIALSGETGEGLPHLHFELRDGDNNPVNPCRAGLDFEDRDPPVLENILLEPLDHLSAVDGGSGPATLSLAQSRAKPVILRGSVRLFLRAFDRAGGESRLGLWELEVKVDGRPFLEEKFDRFSYDRAYLVGTVIDPLLSHLSPTVYAYDLFRHRGNETGVVGFASPLAQGCLRADDLHAGEHLMEITARDAAGNETRGAFSFTVNHPPRAVFGPDLAVSASDPDEPAGGRPPKIEIQRSGDGGLTWTPVAAAEPSAGGASLFRARAFDGLEYSPWVRSAAARPLPPGGPKAEFSLENRGTYLRLLVWRPPPLSADPVVTLTGPGGETVSLPTSWLRGDEYEALWPFEGCGAGTWRASLEGEEQSFTVLPVPAREGGRAAWGDLTADFPPGALYEKAFVGREPSPAPPEERLRPVSRAWRLETTSYPFDKPVTVSLKSDGSQEEPRRVGVYAHDPFRGRWVFAGALAGGEPGWFSAEVRHFSDYALFEDAVPPSISGVRPADGSAGGPPREVSFRLSDLGMGIDDSRVRVELDGSPLLADYDPDRGKVTAAAKPLGKGKHRLDLEVFDRAGNTARFEGVFTIR